MSEKTREETMQDTYRAARERLGRPFTPPQVVIPRNSVPPPPDPSLPPPAVFEKPKRAREKPTPGSRADIMASMVWSAPVSVQWSNEE